MGVALGLVLVVGIGVLALKLLGRPHTAIVIAGGRASVTRGRPPNALVGDLDDLARTVPDAHGHVWIAGRGADAHVEIRGVDEGLAQRIRNVVGLHRASIR